MHVVTIVMVVGWVVFWIGWFVASFGARTSGQSQWGTFAVTRILLIGAVILLVHVKPHLATVSIHQPWATAVGFALYLIGLGLAVWARVYIGRNWGMPMSRKAETELITTGPYRSVRHPIYTGIILALTGTAIATSLILLSAAVIFGWYFIHSARVEERNMTEQFPDSYPAYQRSTKMLIPGIF
jgi:protein-S-isoprenylcysteine O-methyltransferase Ste14